MTELKIRPKADTIWWMFKDNKIQNSTSGMVRKYRYGEDDEARAFTLYFEGFPTDPTILDNIVDMYISITASTNLVEGEWYIGEIKVAAFSEPLESISNAYSKTVSSQNNIIAQTYNITNANTYYVVRDGVPLKEHWDKIKNGIFWYFVEDAQQTPRAYFIKSAEITIVYKDIKAPPNINVIGPSYGTNILSSDVFTLSWEYNQEAGVKQKYIEIECSSNDGESWETVVSKQEYSEDSIDIDAANLPIGLVRIRIKAYSENDVGSDYTETAIYVRVQASTSSVIVDGKPRPTVSWKSSYQIAYQVRFADYDSGVVYGSSTSHTIPYYYADGNYPVQVRTQASNGKWSAWTELEYVLITNTQPSGNVTLSVKKTQHAVVASWDPTGMFDAYILYRNDIPVYVGKDTSYTDVAAFALCSYYVRAVLDKNYIQSNTVEMETKPDVDCIYDINEKRWIPLKYSNEPRSRGYSETSNVIYKYYAGRSSPVAYVDGTVERQLNVNYVFKERSEAEKLQSAKGHLVIYKDTKGGRIIGIIESLSWKVTKLYSVSITIIQVDYKEAVPYET